MCAWRVSSDFTDIYEDALNSKSVRDIAVEACRRANPPISKTNNHPTSVNICIHFIKSKCIHGNACGYSHHPSRGKLCEIDTNYTNIDHIKAKWRSDFHWQLWALAYCEANTYEFRRASDAPLGDLRSLVQQIHSAAENISKHLREAEQARDRQVITEQMAQTERKLAEKDRKKQEKRKREVESAFEEKVAQIAAVIQKEMGESIHDLDESVTVTMNSLAEHTNDTSRVLSAYKLISLTANDVFFSMDAVDLLSNLLPYLWESKKYSRLLTKSSEEKSANIKIAKRLTNAQSSAQAAKGALDTWMERESAQNVIHFVSSLISNAPTPTTLPAMPVDDLDLVRRSLGLPHAAAISPGETESSVSSAPLLSDDSPIALTVPALHAHTSLLNNTTAHQVNIACI